MKAARYILVPLLVLMADAVGAQRFFNLTAEDVNVDSMLPRVGHNMPLPPDYEDSVYVCEILYPEFLDMPQKDVDSYNRLAGQLPPALPDVRQTVLVSRKSPSMLFSLTPIVFRNGKYQFLVSFMLKVEAFPKNRSSKAKANVIRRTSAELDATGRYAAHSVLREGSWAKIAVPATGFCQLTEDVVRRAGFTDINKVKIYGYGGNLVPETLSPDYIMETDDLHEVPSCMVNGKRLFYGKGPVSWESVSSNVRTRNPYSDKGYYFITQSDEEPLLVSDAQLLETNYPAADDYHSLYEVDEYAWYEGGRNLVESATIPLGGSRTYLLETPGDATAGVLTACVTAGTNSTFRLTVNGTEYPVGDISLSAKYDKAMFTSVTYNVETQPTDTVTLTCLSGGPLRLDYISLRTSVPRPAPDLQNASFPAAEYVYRIMNQDHHGDSIVDMTIIIPTSQTLLEQAARLKDHHERHDNISVRIVPADELYNEFSSGTPDVSAYRRYMKMLYDRGDSEKYPKYLLLFGDSKWDNRLLSQGCRGENADNLLLCFESENSYNAEYCLVSDDFVAMLDDNEALARNSSYTGTPDIAIGRFPVTTPAEAKVLVDKTISYAENSNVGDWQNTIMFLGDDGDGNMHMRDVNFVADGVISDFPGYDVRKVYWDAYSRVVSATGNRYPDVETVIKAQQKAGALIIDYAGHGAPESISHEYVLRLTDFADFRNANLPLWITASCDVGPFDGNASTIGEMVVNNEKGGGVAFFGTTRTVLAYYNRYMNEEFVDALLTVNDGKRTTLGEANRIAKTKLVTSNRDLTINKLHYSLLGDPALALNVPLYKCVVESINDIDVSGDEMPAIHANGKVRVVGSVVKDGDTVEDFYGRISVTIRDNAELCTTLGNSDDSPFQYTDRTKILYSGTDSVRKGRFMINFVVPRDINYSDLNGLITMFAYNGDASIVANGESDRFLIGGTEEVFNDSIGPSLYCYLNSPMFVNGGDVNSTPYFVGEIRDNDGINASGAGIGHDMQLTIDSDASRTYNLNDYFQYDFGKYTSGAVHFSIPELTEGHHTLRFRAWDILNNPSTTTLSFNVVKGLAPDYLDVYATKNPVREVTSFIVSHDRAGSPVEIDIEIFDMSGRLLHRISEISGSDTATSRIDWDGSISGGCRLATGVYLYRARLANDGGYKTTKAKKIVVLSD
ncbi:MAG: type IX secretion system sortase PorU [Bacteroidales bacterium]|nr:type IX secretion system sortase PorU [Bacteroidales bacterium]MCM1147182.1 type IX secretion system sortase PorU [Bacteroidales bacterium]MCM1205408.1 type IX secretion system sortase PorU [Bacillota bacterium]MCM1509787.1 type IX secretion system sortase PorU [Clostridium sp.]